MKNLGLHSIFFLFIAVFLQPGTTHAQLSPSFYSYPNNHLPWFTIESEHFLIHFQKGSLQSAVITSQIAEKIYPAVTSLYNFEPDSKTSIVLNDRQDYSNGAAYFFDNQIKIWVPALNTPLRGTHNWLWDVITHEFTHIVQLQTSMKKSSNIPAIYFQWLSYANVRRPDILYGYPKGIITYPFASINVPAWFAEGVAQYQRSHFYYDYWDSHRDMLLRTAVLSGTHLEFEEMASFASKNALERERIYNQGFAFTSFLVEKFEEKVIAGISAKLSKNGLFTINEAVEKATGTLGKELFKEFIRESMQTYHRAVDSLSLIPTTVIENEGFFNFYPKVSPKGNRLAFLSNKSNNYGGIQLFIQSMDKKYQEIHVLNTCFQQNFATHYAQKPVIEQVQSSFSFSPDGSSIAFSKRELNSEGELYNDLFLYNFESDDLKRLTYSRRLSSPNWHPTQKKLVAVQQFKGSTNLILLDLETGSLKPLTAFKNGQQVYTPVWNAEGSSIYFAFSDVFNRDIYRLNVDSGKITPVLRDTLTDYRDPFASNGFLYYAADPDGIFNIYRISLDEKNSQPEKLTSVLGGAFMPHVKNNRLYFAEFKQDGYKISSVEINENGELFSSGTYHLSSQSSFKLLNREKAAKRPDFTSIDAFTSKQIQNLSSPDSLLISFSVLKGEKKATLRPYENTYTGFSFYPVIRFDNYSKMNGSNGRLFTAGKFGRLGENLLRDMKLGTYFSSRDVTGRLSIFGGALFGIASEPSSGIADFFSPSRLTDLDRDLFLITEYRGLPFIEKRWSPTISIELYNLRRNVAGGLSIEEFPCTSCLPDTTKADIAYNIWEADIFLRSKINASNLVEFGLGYSPYRVQTDGFYSRELDQFIPSSSSEYFHGTTFTAAWIFEYFLPYPNRDVAPVGLRTSLRYSYEPSKLLDDYEIEEGVLSPVYQSVKNHSLKLSVQYGGRVTRNSTINLYARGFSYLNRPDDFFYLDYIGGFTGMRSYPYFAIGGNTTAMARLSYIFPVLQDINQQVGRHTLDKLFIRLFAEAGNGWNGPLNIGSNLKTGVGAELRFAFNSYYLFPLKLFVSSAWGFNKFDVTLPESFITETGKNEVQYGNELIFHFGLTFDFNVFN